MNSYIQNTRMAGNMPQRMASSVVDLNRYFGLEAASENDELGLRHLGNFYAPHLMYDIERLFLVEETSSTGMKSVWDDFESNGQESDLDDLDRLFRGINPKPKSPAMSLSADESDSSSTGSINGAQQAMDEIMNKAKLIEILRERERLQRLKPKKPQKKTTAAKVCVFCRNNGEAEAVYSSHQLKDPEGNVTCPVLYIYTCPICGASGKSAHTVKYCPYNTGDSLGVNLLADLTHEKRLAYL